MNYRKDIQGLRALAVLLVVFFHAGMGFSGGYIGVDVFFVVSGFVITGLIKGELESTGELRLGRFYARRVRRILPALAAMTVTVLGMSVLLSSPDGPQQTSAVTARATSLIAGNLHLYRQANGYFALDEAANLFLHTWSLAVEEQFYLVFPALILLAWRRAIRRGSSQQNHVVGVLSICAAASLGLSVWAASGWHFPELLPADKFAYFLPFTRAWEFLAGALLALVWTTATHLRRSAATACSAIGLTAVLVSSLWFDASTLFPGWAALLPVGGTVLLIVGGQTTTVVSRVFASRPAIVIGDWSYSWYLWHWPFIVFAATLWPSNSFAGPIAAFASLVPAVVSYRFLETPLRRSTGMSGRRVGALAACCMVVPLVFSMVVLVGAERHWGIARLAPTDERTLARRNGCHSDDGVGLVWSEENCRFRVPGSTGTVLLVGDSHAISLADAVQSAAAGEQLDLSVWTRSACAFVLADGRDDAERCDGWRRSVTELVEASPPTIAVIVNRSPFGPPPEVEHYVDGMSGALEFFADQGIPVLLVSTGVVFAYSPLGTRSIIRPDGAAPTLSVENLRLHRTVLFSELSALVADRGDRLLLDPLEFMCDVQCPAKDGDVWLYYDSHHLTPEGSERLIEPIRQDLRSLRSG